MRVPSALRSLRTTVSRYQFRVVSWSFTVAVSWLVLASQSALAQQTYKLEYRFSPKQIISTEVIHLANTETTINGNSQESESRTVSEKIWTIESVSKDGTATIIQSLRRVDMSQKLPGHPRVTYNSEKDTLVPMEFQAVANSVQKPLSRIKVDRTGEVVDRVDLLPNGVMPGLGQVVTPLPKKAVPINGEWYFPIEVHVRLDDGTFKKIKTRQRYRLKSVKNGVATIVLKTQVLTPINDRRVEVQLVQQITNGTIRFDMDSGQLDEMEINWDESVVGYRGANSRFKILARYTEKTLSAVEVAARNGVRKK
jgi:hypothetical protein